MEKLKTRKKMITLNEEAKPINRIDAHKGAIIYNNPALDIRNGVFYFHFPEMVVEEGNTFELVITGKMKDGTLHTT